VNRLGAGYAALVIAALLTSCGQIIAPAQPRTFGVVSSASEALRAPAQVAPAPAGADSAVASPTPWSTPTPLATPNPVVTPHSYVKEHQYSDLLRNGQLALIIIAGDRRPSPPASPTPVLQHQKGEYEGNFTYNLQIWNWDPRTNQYTQVASWPNDPGKRYIDMRYHLADLVNDGTQQILVQARLEGVAEALDYAVLRYQNGSLTPIFQQANLEHGQVRLIGRNIWQEQSVRQPNEDPCCPGRYKDDAFFWNGSTFAPVGEFVFPTPSNFPQPTPTPLAPRATPVVGVPTPAQATPVGPAAGQATPVVIPR